MNKYLLELLPWYCNKCTSYDRMTDMTSMDLYLLGSGLAFGTSFALALVGNEFIQGLAWFGVSYLVALF